MRTLLRSWLLALGIAAVFVPTAFASSGGAAGPGGTSSAPAPAPAPVPTGPPPTPAPPPATVTPGGTVPGNRAKLGPDGQALAPANAPDAVKYAIWAGNQLQAMPYVYGGGHQDFVDEGYDCSGTVSYALHAAGLLKTPLDSGRFMRWGRRGRGSWITVFTNSGHAYAVIAGLRLDTSVAGMSRTMKSTFAASAFESGPRWRPIGRSSRGFTKRHPVGF